MLSISSWSVLLRILLKDEKDYLASGGASEWIALLMLLAAVFFWGQNANDCDPAALAAGAAPGLLGPLNLSAIPMEGWAALAVSTLLYTIFAILTYKGLQTVEASERAVVNQVQIGWMVMLSVLLLAERITLVGAAGIALIVFGALLCLYRPTHARWNVEGVKLIAFAAICVGTASLADKVAVKYFPPMIYAIPQYAGPALVTAALMGKDALKRYAAMWRRHYAALLPISAVSILSFIAYLLALQQLPVSTVVPLMNMNVIIGVLAGIVLLKEKEGWPQKIIGALLAFAGAWLLVG